MLYPSGVWWFRKYNFAWLFVYCVRVYMCICVYDTCPWYYFLGVSSLLQNTFKQKLIVISHSCPTEKKKNEAMSELLANNYFLRFSFVSFQCRSDFCSPVNRHSVHSAFACFWNQRWKKRTRLMLWEINKKMIA